MLTRATRFASKVILSLAISAVFVWLSLRNTDVRAVARNIAAADPNRIAGYVALLLFIHVLRTVRWGILLEPFGHVGFKRLNASSAVGFMLLILLPLRLGEFGRPFAIAQRPEGGVRIRRSGAMASCVVERIVDGIAVGLLGVVALRMLGATVTGEYARFARTASLAVAGGFGLLCLVLLAVVFQHELALRAARRILTPLSPRLAERAVGMMDAFLGAVHLGSGWKTVAFFALTAVYWSTNAFGLWLLAPAFGVKLTALMALTVLAIQVVGVMVPAGPGMVGTMQFFTGIGVSLFIPKELFTRALGAQVAAFANTIWLLQFSIAVGLGLVFMAASHITVRGLLNFTSTDAADADPQASAAA